MQRQNTLASQRNARKNVQLSSVNYLEATGQRLTCSSCPVFIRTIEKLITEAENAKSIGDLEKFNANLQQAKDLLHPGVNEIVKEMESSIISMSEQEFDEALARLDNTIKLVREFKDGFENNDLKADVNDDGVTDGRDVLEMGLRYDTSNTLSVE